MVATQPAPPDPHESRIEATYPLIERLLGGVTGLMLGGVVASVAAYLLGLRDAGATSVMVIGSGIGTALGVIRPPRIARAGLAEPARVTPGAPVPVGALGAATMREIERPTAAALVVGMVVGVMSIPAALAAYAVVGAQPSLVIIGLAGTAGFILAIACVAFVPAFLLPPLTRSALAAHLWIGAREFERTLGSRLAVDGFPVETDAIRAWLIQHPETDATREIHVELLLMTGDFEGARQTLSRIGDTTPQARFRRAVLDSMVRYQETGEVDDAPARTALEALPVGPDRVEARVALAAFEARRRLDGGDWREPLVEVRAAIRESDLVIVVRDLGSVSFVMMLRRTWAIVAVLLVLTFGIGIPVDFFGGRSAP